MTIPYWAEDVRRWDRDRFLCALLASEDRRNDLLTLYAFNTEVARIRETVSEPLLGSIRLQWWGETLNGVFAGNPPRHDLAEGLADLVRRRNLSRLNFDRLLNARELDMEDQPPADMQALITYAEGTAATLQALAVEILGGAEHGSEAVRDLGIAWALTGLVRATPFHASMHRTFLPADLLEAEGVDPLHLSPSKKLNGVVEQVVLCAQSALKQSRQGMDCFPKIARNAMLLAPLTDSYLKQLTKAGYNPFDASLRRGAFKRQIKLAWFSFRGHY